MGTATAVFTITALAITLQLLGKSLAVSEHVERQCFGSEDTFLCCPSSHGCGEIVTCEENPQCCPNKDCWACKSDSVCPHPAAGCSLDTALVLVNDTGSITDGSGNQTYQNNLDCYWIINVSENFKALEIHILKLRLEEHSSSTDVVTVYNDFDLRDESNICQYRKENDISTVCISKTGIAVIHFTTDFNGRSDGWELTYKGVHIYPSLAVTAGIPIAVFAVFMSAFGIFQVWRNSVETQEKERREAKVSVEMARRRSRSKKRRKSQSRRRKSTSKRTLDRRESRRESRSASTKNPRRSDGLQIWTTHEVAKWVAEFGKAYGAYGDTFRENGIDGKYLIVMVPDELARLVPTLRHQKKIWQEILKIYPGHPHRSAISTTISRTSPKKSQRSLD